MRKPFYRKSRECWYVKDTTGKFIRLDPDEKRAFTLWEEMRRLADFRHADATLESILEAFLRDMEPRISTERMNRYILFFNGFCAHCKPSTMARTVCGSDVLRWVRSPKQHGRQWSIARQRDAGQAVKRAMKWAINRGYLPWSDILELEFTQPTPRSTTIDTGTHRMLIDACLGQLRSRPFALVLFALRHSGARPIQVRAVTAANHINGHWVFASHKTSGKTAKPLTVRLSPCLHTLTRILAYHRPVGALFLTSQGKPWTKDGIVQRFDRIREKLGLEGISAYSYRHSFATDALEAGVDVATVAALLGHTDPSMVARVYGHLDQRVTHLQRAVESIQTARSAPKPK